MEIIMTAISVWLMVTGVASKAAKHLPTEKWGKVGDAIDWLASNDGKAKLTGDPLIDDQIKLLVDMKEPRNMLLRLIKKVY